MSGDDLVRFAILGDPVIHFVDSTFPYARRTLCGASTEHGKAWVTPRSVDCMTCLVRAGRPSMEDRIVSALGVPKEFLYGKNKDDGADDR
jgi:hypothetical protein